MFLLDTNVVSELRKPRPHGGVRAWSASVPAADKRIPAIVFGEIQAGIEITRQQDLQKAAELAVWADALMKSGDIIPADAVIFRHHARLMHGKSGDLWEDALIAATALEHGLTVATRNVRDFGVFGVQLVNPFDYPA